MKKSAKQLPDTAPAQQRPSRRSTNKDGTIEQRAAARRNRNRAIAEKLRRAGRIATLGSDLAGMIGQISEVRTAADEGYGWLKTVLVDVQRDIDGYESNRESGIERLRELIMLVEKLRFQHHEYTRAVMRELAVHPGIPDELHRAERINTNSIDAIARFRNTLKNADSILKTTDKLTDSLELASLNASLEAGKSQSDVLASIAGDIKTLADQWRAISEEFTATVEGLKRDAGDIAGSFGENADRIRALGAMVQGVGAAIEDIGPSREALTSDIGRLGEKCEVCFRTLGDSNFSVPVEYLVPEELHDRIEAFADIEHEFNETYAVLADAAERLSARAADFSEGSHESADELFDLSEAVTSLAADAVGDIDPAGDELVLIERDIAAFGERAANADFGIDELHAACEDAETIAADIAAAYRSFITGMDTSLDVLRQVVDEFEKLNEEQGGINAVLDTIRTDISIFSRYEGRCAVFALRLDAMTADMAKRAGADQSEGLTRIAAKIAETSAATFEMSASIAHVADALERDLVGINGTARNTGWRERMLFTRSFAAALDDAVNNFGDMQMCEQILQTLTAERANLDALRRGKAISEHSTTAAGHLATIQSGIDECRTLLDSMADAAERLADHAESVLADA